MEDIAKAIEFVNGITKENTYNVSNLEDVFFAKTKPSAIIPSKNKHNAGYDIYACFDCEEIIIKKGEIKMIPTGIASAFGFKYFFDLRERGSSGSRGLSKRCGVIDSNYRGEWFVPINNTTNKVIIISKNTQKIIELTDQVIYPYSKAICQAVLLPVPETKIVEIDYEELKKIESSRGTGCLGSSGK